jgi:hypothetical protein
MSGVRKSFYVILPILSCLFAVLLVELLLAVFYPIPYSLEVNMYFESDPYTGYRHKPDTVGLYQADMPARANRQGNRDAPVAIPKPPGVFRILLIGDSFTVGANVQEADAYGQVLEGLLNASGKQQFEVVNTGVGGWNPFQYAQFLEHYGAQYEPDLVLVGLFVGNDVYLDQFSVDQTLTAVMGRRVTREAAAKPAIGLRVWVYEHSHIYRALISSKPEDESYVRPEGDCAAFTDIYIAIQKQRLPAHFARPSPELLGVMDNSITEIGKMQLLSEQLGARLVVVIIPDENQLNPALQGRIIPAAQLADYDFDMPQHYLRKRFAEQGIPTLDLLDVFRNDARCLYMNDTHWVPAGHALVAEQIYEFLRTSKLVP